MHPSWHGQKRFIPARAGNGASSAAASWTAAVHPRARGEREVLKMTTLALFGSSPRARGTVLLADNLARLARFIPARAGNGRSSTTSRATSSVHPRARGERSIAARRYRGANGSSPRARGTDHNARHSANEFRFIPARAGNGDKLALRYPCLPVHPRARGERFFQRTSGRQYRGSSPRARGTGRL